MFESPQGKRTYNDGGMMARRLDLLKGVWVDEKPKVKRQQPEERTKDEIRAWLESRGFYMRVIKSDGRKLPNGKWIPSKQGRGISDLIGVTPDGRFVAVEVKAVGKEKTATPEQLNFIREILERGGIGVVVSSVKQVEWAVTATTDQLKTEYRLLAASCREL
jgi:hypothetical protein